MKEMDIADVLKKAEELRALFVLGQRVIPFLEEIFVFVSEIKPLLDEINTSIEENLKKMPSASKQLSKVSEATETATTEIMDIVDGLSYKVDLISSNVKKICSSPQKVSNHFKVIELIYKAIQEDVDVQDILPEISETIENMKSANSEGPADKSSQSLIEDTDNILQSIKDDSMSIMISLQVQDITSQQIAAVNHLLETIQTKLQKILVKFQASDINQLVTSSPEIKERTNVVDLHRKVAFDPDAIESISSKETRQNDVDDLIKMHFNGEIDISESSTEEIESAADSATDNNSDNNSDNKTDNNSDNNSDNNRSVQASENDVSDDLDDKVSIIPDDIEHFSQDDIDAIFGK
ncbi:MAG: hypothetical protein GX121_02615 [Ignavibacteria bacterium]|jgi:chemotaxis regulatin CheY-phosphate phosphatase CheZ|nr:hypothetical protein [Ignavibacteria bacterium]